MHIDGYIQIDNVSDKQKVLLYLLKCFHELCEKNGLVYNAFGGTMLGAVRHHGFIPWDDDIDVTMPRNDYIKLIRIIKEAPDLVITVHGYPDDNYIYPYAKVGLKDTIQYENVVKTPHDKLTINMDVFPVDGYPEDEAEIDEYCSYEENIILCTYKLNKSYFVRHPKKLIKKVYSQMKGYKYWVAKQISLASKNKIEDCSNLICNGAGWGRKGIIEKRVYFDRVLFDFEGMRIWGIRDYDQHLTRLYGDYMKLPPVDKRTSPHDDTVLVSNEIYSTVVVNG